MTSRRLYSKLRLFLASPSDLSAEREVVVRTVARLNTSPMVDQLGAFLEVVRWESHVSPLMGRPQQAILDQIEIGSCDLFVGMLWSRFGTPTGAIDPKSRREFQSGTEEEFRIAHDCWEKHRRPNILFFRCNRPRDVDAIDVDQLASVHAFFKEFGPSGRNPGLFQSFVDAADFEKLFVSAMRQTLQRIRPDIIEEQRQLAKRVFGLAEVESIKTEPISIDPITRLLGHLRQGEVAAVAFLSVDIVGHSKLVDKYVRNGRGEDAGVLIAAFYYLVRRLCLDLNGDIFYWAGDGGILIFWGDRHCSSAILAGLRIANGILPFNLDSRTNPLGESISIRLAANDASILFRTPLSTISAPSLNLVEKIQKRARPGHFIVTKKLLARVEPNLAAMFRNNGGRLQGEELYSYAPPERRSNLQSNRIRSTVEKSAALAERIRLDLLDKQDVAAQEDTLGAHLHEFYALIEAFCDEVGEIDERLSSAYLKALLDAARTVELHEEKTWKNVEELGAQLTHGSPLGSILETIIETVASRRSRPVLTLRRIKHLAETLSLPGEAPAREVGADDSRVVKTLVERFAVADALGSELLLTELVMLRREALADYVRSRGPAALPLDRLWELADLVVQYDYGGGSPVLVEALGPCDARFDLLRAWMDADTVTREEIELAIAAVNGPRNAANVDIIWRCLLVGHSNAGVRGLAAARVLNVSENSEHFGAMGRLVARSELPLTALIEIAKKLRKIDNVGFKKLFFDCTRRQIASTIDATGSKQAVAALTPLMMIFLKDFDFLVETPYFSRLDALLSRFLERVSSVGLKVKYFEDLRGQLRLLREERAHPVGQLPEGIRRYPLWIQRKLAGEMPYLKWFVDHPDDRIAMETRHNITRDNVHQVLAVQDINMKLFHSLLENRSIFAREVNRVLALVHPKCELAFAAWAVDSFGIGPSGLRSLKNIAQKAKRPEIRRAATMRLRQVSASAASTLRV